MHARPRWDGVCWHLGDDPGSTKPRTVGRLVGAVPSACASRADVRCLHSVATIAARIAPCRRPANHVSPGDSDIEAAEALNGCARDDGSCRHAWIDHSAGRAPPQHVASARRQTASRSAVMARPDPAGVEQLLDRAWTASMPGPRVDRRGAVRSRTPHSSPAYGRVEGVRGADVLQWRQQRGTRRAYTDMLGRPRQAGIDGRSSGQARTQSEACTQAAGGAVMARRAGPVRTLGSRLIRPCPDGTSARVVRGS